MKQPIVKPDNCYKAYAAYRDDIELCVGGGQSTCDADAGGPIQCMGLDDNLWYQMGVQSYGPDPCGKAHEPDVYGRVSVFIDWVKKQH